MSLEMVRSMLAWCTVIDIVVILWWFGWFVFAHDFVYRVHSRWFPMPVEKFNAIHYAAMAVFKICMLVFHLGPYLALRIIG